MNHMGKKRMIVKIGSSSLTNERGEIDRYKFTDHILAIAKIQKMGHEVIVVSSGAVAAGFRKLGYSSRPITLKGKQASAAIGQGLLIQSYMEALLKFDTLAAQILLTRSDFNNQVRFRNAYDTIMELLDRKVIPIINENDTVSIEELTFGDNDMLSALVSGLVHADLLVILTDINGLYDQNPFKYPNASRIDFLNEITDVQMKATDGAGSKVGTGGMYSKLNAAKTAMELNVPVFIGTGKGEDKLISILNGTGDGTYLSNQQMKKINTKRQWIALHSTVKGKIYVDKGAEKALVHGGGSLLSPGIVKIDGSFLSGEVVEVRFENQLIARGEVSCSSQYLTQTAHEKNRIKEVIHRDKLVLESNRSEGK